VQDKKKRSRKERNFARAMETRRLRLESWAFLVNLFIQKVAVKCLILHHFACLALADA